MTIASNLSRWALLTGLLAAGGCFSNSDGNDMGGQSSSGSHWLACDEDADCAAHGATCADDGAYKGRCVSAEGEPIVVSGGTAGASAGASGTGASGTGASGTGGTGDCGGAVPAICKQCADNSCGVPKCVNGSYEFVCPEDGPCTGRSCGDDCTGCGPADDCESKTCDASGNCVLGSVSCGGGTAGTGMGVAYPDCGSLGGSEGAMCGGQDDKPVPECCDGSAHLRCEFVVCTASIPGTCSGTFKAVPGSTACGGTGGYEPCAAKNCGDTCTLCDPNDKMCVETADIKVCTGTGGMCVSGAVDCSPPEKCDPSGANTCGDGMACCEIGRCGPVGTLEGQCEAADPVTGGCKPCACAMQPGGCPICNSPDTPILTPTGERAVADLREGDLVLSMHEGALVAAPIVKTRQAMVTNHAVVRLVFDNGERVEISGSHPTADGRRLDALVPGDVLGEVRVVSVETVPYGHDRTYDILPASDSGTYVAGGALIGSTLAMPGVE
jgi:hypothetical protein